MTGAEKKDLPAANQRVWGLSHLVTGCNSPNSGPMP